MDFVGVKIVRHAKLKAHITIGDAPVIPVETTAGLTEHREQRCGIRYVNIGAKLNPVNECFHFRASAFRRADNPQLVNIPVGYIDNAALSKRQPAVNGIGVVKQSPDTQSKLCRASRPKHQAWTSRRRVIHTRYVPRQNLKSAFLIDTNRGREYVKRSDGNQPVDKTGNIWHVRFQRFHNREERGASLELAEIINRYGGVIPHRNAVVESCFREDRPGAAT